MHLHSGAVALSPRSAGDAGQHGGDDRGRTWRSVDGGEKSSVLGSIRPPVHLVIAAVTGFSSPGGCCCQFYMQTDDFMSYCLNTFTEFVNMNICCQQQEVRIQQLLFLIICEHH